MSEILDQDMQMVRDFLKQWGAPFHVTEHFENLVSEYWKEAARVEDLRLELEEERSHSGEELARMQERIDNLEQSQDDADDMRSVLETVKYWLHDAIYLRRPMRTAPRDILRQVEDAL